MPGRGVEFEKFTHILLKLQKTSNSNNIFFSLSIIAEYTKDPETLLSRGLLAKSRKRRE